MKARVLFAALFALMLAATVGCKQEEEGTMEKMGKAMDEAAHDVEDAAHDAGDAIKDAAHDVEDAVKEAGDDD